MAGAGTRAAPGPRTHAVARVETTEVTWKGRGSDTGGVGGFAMPTILPTVTLFQRLSPTCGRKSRLAGTPPNARSGSGASTRRDPLTPLTFEIRLDAVLLDGRPPRGRDPPRVAVRRLRPAQPLPAKGISRAITVILGTETSVGKDTMCATVSATCTGSMVASAPREPSACNASAPTWSRSGVLALPTSIWVQAIP